MMTDKQKAALQSIASGSGNLALVHFSKLRYMEFVESSGQAAGQRGYVNAKITDAGRAALAG